MFIVAESFHDSVFSNSETEIFTFNSSSEKDLFIRNWIEENIKGNFLDEQVKFILENYQNSDPSYHLKYVWDEKDNEFIEGLDEELPWGISFSSESEYFTLYILEDTISFTKNERKGYKQELTIKEI